MDISELSLYYHYLMSSSGTQPKVVEQETSFISSFVDTRRPFDIEGIPLKLYLLLTFLSIMLLYFEQVETSGLAGAFALMWTIGFFFFAIGERVLILKNFLGGGLVIAYFGAAFIAYSGLVSKEEIAFLQSHIVGNQLFYFILAALIVSSVLSVSTAILKKALLSYAPIIIGGLCFAAISGITAGILVGVPIDIVVTRFFLPIMGGGAGAGAIPMSEIYGDVTNGNVQEYFTYAIGVLTLGNITAILIASLLAQLVKKIPALSGDGRLVKGAGHEQIEEEVVDTQKINTHSAMVVVVCILLAGMVLSARIGLIHMFAWVTIIAIILNFTRVVSPALRESMKKLSGWVLQAFLVTVLVAFGLSADFTVIAEILSPGNLFIIVSIVVGAGTGAGLVSHFVNCYPMEGALSGGLCMANAGGSGDLQVLGAAKRIQLYPYAQISSRLGGAFMLILANYLFNLLS